MIKKPFIALIAFSLLFLLFIGYKFFSQQQQLQLKKPTTSPLTDIVPIKEGDIIFQTSLSEQSKAIQLATHSIYSHCGIIFKRGDKNFVFEAVQPVKETPLEEWIARGKNKEYVIKRLKHADEILTTATIEKMKTVAKQFYGKNYDLTFEWNDEKIYCSELIWKIYERATDIKIGKTQKLKDFDLSQKTVKEKLRQRYGSNIPINETVISPAAIFNSDLLTTIKAN